LSLWEDNNKRKKTVRIQESKRNRKGELRQKTTTTRTEEKGKIDRRARRKASV